MEKTCDEILDKLPKLSKYRNELIQKTENDHLIERLSYVSEFPPELQQEWQTAGNNLKHKEKIIFYKNTSNVLIKAKDGNVFTSLSALLLACCAYEYYFTLLDYQSVVEKLLQNCDSKDKAATQARNDQSGFLVNSINNEIHNLQNKEKILEFTTDYSAWGGGKTINRGDFWVSTIYSTFNVVQSRSDIHTLVRYIDTAKKSNKLEDNKLYQDTHKIVDKILTETANDTINADTTNINTIKGGKNLILYGAPGTGKSYELTQKVKELGIKDYNPKEDNPLVFRTTLHPEYEYSDFVGQLQPVVKTDSTNSKQVITYQFTPGVFTEALKQAIKHSDQPVVLILEEMSRANVAGVFGDIFQLLDRDSEGRSEYDINNDLIANYVFGDSKRKVYIPANMSILGTVNTSDQNVFVMDTAFKRRFLWEYVSTILPDDTTDSFVNNPQIKIIGLDTPTDWKTFFTNLNNFIVNELELTEDKQIGAYFIKFPQGSSTNQKTVQKLLKNKLLQYLWQDVAINPNQTLFSDDIHSFSALYSKFDNEQIFSQNFLDTFSDGEQ